MELTEAKITAMIGLGLSSMLVGLLPAWFSAHGRLQWPLFLSSLLCFGGGVLMSTSLVHMLPEIREAMPKYQQYAELIFCAGFFIVYIIDEFVHFCYSDAHDHDTGATRNSQDCNPSKAIKRRHSFSYQRKSGYGSTEYQPLLYGDCSHRQPSYNPSYSGIVSNSPVAWDDQPPSQLCHVGHQEPCDASPIGNVGLLIALSVHALLEGLAIGLQRSSSQVLLLLGAVASHKLVVGFCLGVELASTSGSSACRHFVSITIFSLGSVIGIGGGMAITEIPKDILEIAFPVLQGLAGGTLLYVTVSEVLPRERARWHKHHHRRVAGIVQLISVAVGFVIMASITFCLDDHN